MAATLKTARIGDTLCIYDAAGEQIVKKMIIPDGHAMIKPDGSAEWVADIEVVDTTKQGSNQYTWDKTGNRIRHARTRFTKASSGEITSVVEKFIYKKME